MISVISICGSYSSLVHPVLFMGWMKVAYWQLIIAGSTICFLFGVFFENFHYSSAIYEVSASFSLCICD